ncbi:MAG: mechanosensitive ion channel family protein [Bacteroidota bacterium]
MKFRIQDEAGEAAQAAVEQAIENGLEEAEVFSMDKVMEYLIAAQDAIVAYLPKILIAVIILWIGMRLINRLVNWMNTVFEKRDFSPELRPFLKSVFSATLKILLILLVANLIGLPVTSFVAILAAAGFAVGMALQGSLSNFASGVMILIFRPYKVGDLIEIEDQMGHVKEIQIFNTVIVTLDNRMVIIPNSTAIGGMITNLSAEEHLRIDLNINMPYSEDFDKVEQILLNAVKSSPKVLENPAPMVGIESYDTHFIVLAVRPYARVEDYWDVYFEVNKNMKKAFNENGIQVAYSEGVELGPIGK